MKKRILALLTAALMLFSMTPVFADEPDAATLRGTGSVQILPIEVVLPTDLDFVLDPLLGAGGESQGGNDPFFMWNLSEGDVLVHWAIIFAPGEDVEFDSTIEDPEFNPGVTELALNMGVIVANDITFENDPDLDDLVLTGVVAAIADEDNVFDADAAATVTMADDLTGDAEGLQGVIFGFGLEGVDDDADDLLAENVAAFKFYAYMNAFAPWSEDYDAVEVAAIVSIVPDFEAIVSTGNGAGLEREGHNDIGAAAVLLDADLDELADLVGFVPPPPPNTILNATAIGELANTSVDGNVITITNARTAGSRVLTFLIYDTTTAAAGIEGATITGTAATVTHTANNVTVSWAAGVVGENTLTVVRDGVENTFIIELLR